MTVRFGSFGSPSRHQPSCGIAIPRNMLILTQWTPIREHPGRNIQHIISSTESDRNSGGRKGRTMPLTISPSAKKFMDVNHIDDVTFTLMQYRPAGCCVGIVKEIQAVHDAPKDASHYRYFKEDSRHFFISRDIKILGPLTVTVDGFWSMKRLGLRGAGIPL